MALTNIPQWNQGETRFQYIDVRFMTELFGHREMVQLSDRDGVPTHEIIPPVIARHIESAESIANSYLSTVYTLPLPMIPRALQLHVADIARYYLYDEMPTQIVIDRYNMAMKWLSDVAAGKVDLGFPDSNNQVLPDTVTVIAGRQVFTDEKLSQMDVGCKGINRWNGGF